MIWTCLFQRLCVTRPEHCTFWQNVNFVGFYCRVCVGQANYAESPSDRNLCDTILKVHWQTLRSTLSISVHASPKSKQPSSNAYNRKLCPVLHEGWSTFNIPNSSSFVEDFHTSLLVVSSSNNNSWSKLSLMLLKFYSVRFKQLYCICGIVDNISCVSFSRLEYTHCSSTVNFPRWSDFCVRSFVKFIACPFSSYEGLSNACWLAVVTVKIIFENFHHRVKDFDTLYDHSLSPAQAMTKASFTAAQRPSINVKLSWSNSSILSGWTLRWRLFPPPIRNISLLKV